LDRDSEGNVIDPVSLNVIPFERLIVVKEVRNGKTFKWCMDASILLENRMLYGNSINPVTRNPLSRETITKLDTYRQTQLKTISLINVVTGEAIKFVMD